VTQESLGGKLKVKMTGSGPGEVPMEILLVFLNAYRNNLQVHGYTVVAFYPEVFRVYQSS
jgi:hypothetical protein